MAAPQERRPAIWPWLVMPLATLALFYALDQLHHQGTRTPSGVISTADTP